MPTSSKEEEVNLNGSVLIESLTASTTPPPRFLSLSRLEILYPLGNSSWLETELLSHVSVLDTGLVLMFGVQVWIQVRD